MKKNTSYTKITIYILLILVFFFGIYVIYKGFIKNNSKENQTYLKNYSVNEYIPTYVSEEQMARIYLSTFINLVLNNPSESYNVINSEYKDAKFNSLSNYLAFIKSKKFSYTLKNYAVDIKSGYTYFYIYDIADNYIIFKTKGVMQYEIYFDEYTVEI